MAKAELLERTDGRTDDPVELTEENVFEVLSNQRRRYAYHYLKQVDQRPVDVKELTNHVAAWEYDKDPERVNTDERNRVATALRQFHLPKMDETGFVDYDRTRGEAVLREEAADLEVYLDVVPHKDVPWSRYYLGLTGLHALLVGAAVLDAGPLEAVSPLAAASFAVVTLAVSAAVHAYYTKGQRYGATESPPGVDDP
jgi:hypothetical protein